MKKIFLGAVACAAAAFSAIPAHAEGYQVNTLSSRQNGMGHTGVAIPTLGSESMFFNPAGLALLKDQIEFSGSFNAVIPSAKATLPSGKVYENVSTTATPLDFNLGMKVNDRVAVGLSFYTPYGSNIDWSDNWAGAELNQRVKLSVFTVQPTVAWKPVEGLTIGGGLMISWGNVDLCKGLINPTTMDGVLAMSGIPYSFGETTPASVRLKGNSAVALGVNIGAMWQINPQWTVGASWRSQQTMKVKSGQAAVSFANEIAEGVLENTLGLLQEANFRAQMPAPWVFSVGASYRPTEKWLLAADVQLTGWKAYRQLDIEFLSEQLRPFDQHIPKHYHNSLTYKIGAQYSVTRRFDARLGLMIDTSPVDKDYYNPETPGCTKIAPSVGLSFSPVRNFCIDASVLYVAGLDRTGSCTYTDMLTGQPVTFTADYHITAWVPSVGVRLMF